MLLITKQDIIPLLTQPIIDAICNKTNASMDDFEIIDGGHYSLKIMPKNNEIFPNGIVLINTDGYKN